MLLHSISVVGNAMTSRTGHAVQVQALADACASIFDKLKCQTGGHHVATQLALFFAEHGLLLTLKRPCPAAAARC